MNGCPAYGCQSLNTLNAAKELCIQDPTCNGILKSSLRCPYNDCNIYEIRRGPIIQNEWTHYSKESVYKLIPLPCEGNWYEPYVGKYWEINYGIYIW